MLLNAEKLYFFTADLQQHVRSQSLFPNEWFLVDVNEIPNYNVRGSNPAKVNSAFYPPELGKMS